MPPKPSLENTRVRACTCVGEMGEITTFKLGYFMSIFVNNCFLKSISSSLGTEQCVTNDRHSFLNIRLYTQFSHCVCICMFYLSS